MKVSGELLVPALKLAYKCAPHSAAEVSPVEVMIGQNPITVDNIDLISALQPTVTPPMTKQFMQLCNRSHDHIARAKWLQKQNADSMRRDVEFDVGDLVWLKARTT